MIADMEALVEKLERCLGPDRELDGEICAVLQLHPAGWRRGVKEASADAIWFDGGYGRSWSAPSFSSSIDAAMTLVPEGRAIRREYCPAGSWPHRVWIYRDSFMPLDDGSRRPVLGKTEALALCIAALRARSASRGTV